jgi:hypothetical protein
VADGGMPNVLSRSIAMCFVAVCFGLVGSFVWLGISHTGVGVRVALVLWGAFFVVIGLGILRWAPRRTTWDDDGVNGLMLQTSPGGPYKWTSECIPWVCVDHAAVEQVRGDHGLYWAIRLHLKDGRAAEAGPPANTRRSAERLAAEIESARAAAAGEAQ